MSEKYGPNTEQVQAFIDSIPGTLAARDAAWYAARDAARNATWDAARYAAALVVQDLIDKDTFTTVARPWLILTGKEENA